MLITPGMQWPPPGHWKLRRHWLSWAAWWSGDIHRLMADTPHTAPNGYWQRRNKPGTKYHLPLAADMARTMAELMYGDEPKITFEGDSDEVQTAWDELSRKMGFGNTLLQSGEVGAALGGSFLRPGWHPAFDRPLSMVSRPDMALPEFLFDELHTVTFVTELTQPADWTTRNRGEMWRWLEHHEPGQIRHELWIGSGTTIGSLLPLTDHPHTKDLEPVIDTTRFRPTGILCDYIPNDLPQPLDTDPHGRSVLQGVETLLDGLDETWDSWMRDIRLGKGRIFVARELLQPVGQRTGAVAKLFGRSQPARGFDEDAEAFVQTETAPEGTDGKPAPISNVQLGIRLTEHAGTAAGLLEQIVSRQGFDPQTFGVHVDGQQSGTALRIRNQRSFRTADRGHGYARPGVERHIETIMLINAELFGGPKPTKRPSIEWRESQMDPKAVAEIVDLLNRAQAASLEVRIGLVHPDWDDPRIAEEAAAILAEQSAGLPEPPMSGFEADPPTDQNAVDATQDPATEGA